MLSPENTHAHEFLSLFSEQSIYIPQLIIVINLVNPYKIHLIHYEIEFYLFLRLIFMIDTTFKNSNKKQQKQET